MNTISFIGGVTTSSILYIHCSIDNFDGKDTNCIHTAPLGQWLSLLEQDKTSGFWEV